MCRQKAEAEAAADVQGGKSGKTQLPLPSLSSFLSPFLSDRTNGHFAARITVIIAIENSKVWLTSGHFFLLEEGTRHRGCLRGREDPASFLWPSMSKTSADSWVDKVLF